MTAFRKALPAECDAVIAFYHTLIADMADSPYHPEWKIGIYPETEFIYASVENGELYIYETDGAWAGVCVLNHTACEGYDTAPWRIPARTEEITVVHALGVAKAFQGRGVAQAMVREIFSVCRENGQKTVRLDVLKKNLPAKHLYEKAGFYQVAETRLYYEDTGWTDFYLYEYPL